MKDIYIYTYIHTHTLRETKGDFGLVPLYIYIYPSTSESAHTGLMEGRNDGQLSRRTAHSVRVRDVANTVVSRRHSNQ